MNDRHAASNLKAVWDWSAASSGQASARRRALGLPSVLVSADLVRLDRRLLAEIRSAVGEGKVDHFIEEAARTRLRDLASVTIIDELLAEVGPMSDDVMPKGQAFWTSPDLHSGP